ncbi:MAG TPA: adenylate/guanylate cyclase domain-containing protein [Actinomycetota bacterium]|nr:adenylate/guanylate cyclase domain-containing protein [Actinomycetota bacterium]
MTETRGERKLVTLLFSDLTGYTALAASLDPEEVFSFIQPTMVELQRVVEDHGGTVPQVQGDGFMAIFGVPAAHEDDAERAVRAALAVRDRVRELNEGRSGLAIPEVHSGVNSGEVMVGPAPEASGIAVVGDVVNTASRLADLAPPGAVLVEEQTWRRTRHAIRYGPRRSYAAKGKPRPVAAYEARTPRTPFPAGRATPSLGAEFVDREGPLERLSAELRAVREDRRARVVIVSAEPGAGKTRLASEFTGRDPDVLVLAGRATAYGASLALSPLAAAIGEIAGVGPGSTAADRRIRALAKRVTTGVDVRHVTRGLSMLLGVSDRFESHGSRGTEDAIAAARTVLEGLARERTVVVVLDDLHWADPAVVNALAAVATDPWAGPILFMGLTRSDSPLDLGAATRIELDAIPDDAMGELTSLALGRKSFTSALRRIVTRAGGNPLFLEESLSMLVDAGALVSTASGWSVIDPEMLDRVPTTVRAMIAARLDGLPPAEKRVLQCASVTGELTWDRLLERLIPEADVRTAVRSLLARDLLRRRRGSHATSSNEFVFKHALIRDVAYGSLPREERARLHVEVADWLSHGANMPREPVDDLAHHYAEAWRLSGSMTATTVPDGLARAASLYLGRWADETLEYQALAAESLYARAIEVDTAAPDDVEPELRARHAIGRAECLIELGRHREAERAATHARELAEGLDDERLGARALVALGRVESDVGDDDRAEELLERALTSFRAAGDTSGEAWATHRLSEISTRTDYAEGLAYLRRAYQLFEEAGDRWGRVIAAQDLAYMLSTIGGEEFHRWYRMAKQLVEGDGDLRSRAELLRTLGYFRYYCGQHAEAITIMREARPLTIAAGDRYAEADTLLIEALAAAAACPPTEAANAAAAAVAFGREIHSARVQALGRAAQARAALRSGDPRGATRHLATCRRGLERFGASTEMLEADLAAAEVQLDRGAWGRVRKPADAGTVASRASGERLIEPVGVLLVGRAALGAGRVGTAFEALEGAVALARAAGASGTLSIARAARDQAVLLSGRTPRGNRRPGSGTVVEAIEAENHGLASMMDGGNEEAAAALREAVERWSELGWTSWLARALSIRGEALRRDGDRARAGSARARARRVLDRLETPEGGRDAILAPLASRSAEASGGSAPG